MNSLCLAVCTCFVWPVLAMAQAPVTVLEAARANDLDALRASIAADRDVQHSAGDGASALHWAAYHGNAEAVSLLLDAGADADASNDLGATPLWLAALAGDGAVVDLLLAADADPDAALNMGETALMAAARSGDPSIVASMLALGADVNAREDHYHQTALMWAAAQRHSEVVRRLLEAGADIAARSRVRYQYENTAGNTNPSGNFTMAHGGSSALLFVARNGDVDTARVLLDAGADVNDANAAGVSALVMAAHSGHEPLARFLLARGADPNADAAGYTALHAAVRRGLAALVGSLLDAGADRDAVIKHGTPGRRFSADYSIRAQLIGRDALWLAAKYGEVEIVAELLARGADAFAVDARGATLLHVAMGNSGSSLEHRGDRIGNEVPDKDEEEQRTQALAEMLLNAGLDVNAADRRGWTAIHHAVIKDFPSVVEYLVIRGAATDVLTERGATPLELAETEQTIPGSNGLRGTRPAVAEVLQRLGGA